MKYSINQLETIQKEVNNFILSNENLPSKVLFTLRWNSREANQSKELIEQDLKQLDESTIQKLQEYNTKRKDLLEDAGAEIVNGKVINAKQLLRTNDVLQNQLKTIEEKYESELDQFEEIQQFNEDKSKEQIAEVEFKTISLDSLPETLTDFPESFLEFVTTNIQKQ